MAHTLPCEQGFIDEYTSILNIISDFSRLVNIFWKISEVFFKKITLLQTVVYICQSVIIFWLKLVKIELSFRALRVKGVFNGSVCAYNTLPVKIQQIAVHAYHAFVGKAVDSVVYLMYLAFADHISDSAVAVHYFKSRHQLAVNRGYKLLRNNRLQ